MLRISLSIRKSQPNRDGSFNLKISLANKGQTVFIPTRYCISSLREWNGGRVVRRADADVINRRLFGLLTAYEEIISANPVTESMDVRTLRDFLQRRLAKDESVVSFTLAFIAKLRDNRQFSYASNMEYTLRYLLEHFGESLSFQQLDLSGIQQWERFLFERGDSSTTVNIRMSHLKALMNAAVREGLVEYKVFPFSLYRMPTKAVRDICLSREDLARFMAIEFEGESKRRMELARDLFLLSFYFGGINLTDLLDADFSGDSLCFVRKKTAGRSKQGKAVCLTIQPEARVLLNKYVGDDGRLHLGYAYSKYEYLRSYVTKSLNKIGEVLGFPNRLMFYSARKTFCQFGFEIGIPLFVLEYAIGHTIKDEHNRPIFNYFKVMQKQADAAIRSIIDFSREVN